MTWCHHYQITLRPRHIPGCLNVMSDLLSSPVSRMVNASAVVQTDLSSGSFLCRSTCHSSKVPLYASPVPVQHAWDIDALNINWSGLTAYTYPPMALLHRVIHVRQYKLPDHCNDPRLAKDALVLGPSAALNRDPTSVTSVNSSSHSVPQLCISQQSTTSQPPRLVSRSGWLQGRSFSVEVAERITASQRSSTRIIYKSSGPYLKNDAEKIWWISPLPL